MTFSAFGLTRWRAPWGAGSLGSALLTAALPCPRCPGPRRPAGLVGQCLRWACSSSLRRLSCLPPGSLKKLPVPMLSKYLLLQACFPAVLKAHSFSTCSPVPPWSAPQAPVCLRSLPVPWGVSPHVRLGARARCEPQWLLGFGLTSLLCLLMLLSLLRRAALLLGSRVPWFRSMPRCLSRLCVVGAFLSPFVRSPCFYFSENSHFLEKMQH